MAKVVKKKTTTKAKAAPKKSTKKTTTAKAKPKAKTATKKATTTKAAPKKAAPKKAATKKAAPKKAAAKKAPAKTKTAVKKAAPKKAAAKKAAPKKAATKKAAPKKAAPKKAAPKTAAKKTASKPAAKPKAAGKAKVKASSVKPATKKAAAKSAKKRSGDGPQIVSHYQERKGEHYMNDSQREHFITILNDWKNELMVEVDRTVHHMKDESQNLPDPNDRASQEEEFSIELRTRDRERKLIRKIEKTLDNIEQDDYGYCEDCGIEIGIKRLEVRPTATQCIDCKTLAELKEKQTVY